MRKFFNEKLFTYILAYQNPLAYSICRKCNSVGMTVKYSKIYISKYQIFLFRYTRRKKTATAFYVCAVFELQFLFMQPVYRFSLLSGKVSIINGFGNDIALPVIQSADRNIMHTQLPQIVQRYA